MSKKFNVNFYVGHPTGLPLKPPEMAELTSF